MEKVYYGGISFAGRITFEVKARNKEEVREKVYEMIKLNIDSTDEKQVTISDVDWQFEEKPRGNVAPYTLQNFEIYEEN